MPTTAIQRPPPVFLFRFSRALFPQFDAEVLIPRNRSVLPPITFLFLQLHPLLNS